MDKIFQDRISSNPNRRKITIESQTDGVIYGNIEFADNPTQEGTPITADLLNQMNNEINANTANASSALATANEAKALAEEAKNSSTSSVGTVVKVGGVNQTSWDADTKLDKNQGSINVNKTMVVGSSGTVTPSDYIYIGNIKVYQDADGLAFEFPDEA